MDKKIQLKHIPAEAILRQQHAWTMADKNGTAVGVLPWTYEAFPQWPAKLVLAKMVKLADEGYLEYGVSLRTAWLTDKGLAMIGESARKNSMAG